MKPCATCNEVKPLSEFYKHPLGKDGHFKHCKPCDRKRERQWVQDNPEQDKNTRLLRKYGITAQIFDKMLEDQCGRCAICGTHFESSKNTNVDHCHTTGKVRSLLCKQCNIGLGHFKDSVQILENAVQYLNQHSNEEQ
jgi:hypothetical protein